jgi:hypothetical protein
LHFRYKSIRIIILFVLLLPLISEFQGEGGWARIRGISIWNDPGVIARINETRGQLTSIGWTPPLARLIANKATIFSLVFIHNFFTHFTFRRVIMGKSQKIILDLLYCGY